ncbi:hypothetical protein FF011L_54190 [Roseimaritima multifibrata]|uniref:Uncharacterized protein n=2 Tax=Roseimaritima multifibrata TaxID=1930274 RepID=A0A517MPA4_9BACT|nr:hypothetical protein FF011L_54190 [Roseimaritima multifibrata]
MSSMNTLIQRLVDLADQQAVSPVLVAEKGLHLQIPFYLAIGEQLAEKTERQVHFEFMTGLSVLERWGQAWMLKRLQRSLAASTNWDVTVERTAVVSRPAGNQRPFVLGFATSVQSLPSWATAVRLSAHASPQADFRLAIEAA